MFITKTDLMLPRAVVAEGCHTMTQTQCLRKRQKNLMLR